MAYVIKDRALVEAVKRASEEHGIGYQLFSDGWVIRLQKDGAVRFIFAYFIDCNSQAASMIAVDKVATYLLLNDAAIPAVPHYLVKSLVNEVADGELLAELLKRYGEVVLKPLRGKRGLQVTRVDSLQAATLLADKPSENGWAAAPLVDIRREVRLVVFGETILLAYEKTDPITVNGLAMYNLDFGARPQDLSVDELPAVWRGLAVGALQAIGLVLGAVDIVIDAEGKAMVLEINSGFSLEHYAASSSQRRSLVIEAYIKVIAAMFAKD